MIKYFYLSIVLLCSSMLLTAQTISYEMDSIVTTSTLNEDGTHLADIEAHIKLHNNGGAGTFKWEKEVVEAPEGWAFAVCDLNTCYIPTIDTKEFEFDADTNFLMILHAYPGGNPGATEGGELGTATVRVKVSEVENPSNEVVATYVYTLDAATGILEVELQSLRVYPNPTQDLFRVSDNEYVKNIRVMNLIGQTVLEQPVDSDSVINVKGLDTGLYLVQMMDENKEILKTVRLMKK